MAATQAVFCDALGTVLELERPFERLRLALGDGIPEERVAEALRAEMAYYRDHSQEGRDAASLADLRERAAAVLSERLGREVGVETLMDAIRFRAFDDSAPALAALRARGLTTVCVSNWDSGLATVLDRAGLGDCFDATVSSAEVGARKPDPAVFEAALKLAGCRADEALHVGDTPEEDLDGARAAGVRALLIARKGGGDIASLDEIVDHLAR